MFGSSQTGVNSPSDCGDHEIDGSDVENNVAATNGVEHIEQEVETQVEDVKQNGTESEVFFMDTSDEEEDYAEDAKRMKDLLCSLMKKQKDMDAELATFRKTAATGEFF